MKRRELLKKAGIGLTVLVFLLILVNTLSTPALADDEEMNFTLVAVSKQVRGTDLVIFNGAGKFSAEEVEGGGSFTHFRPTERPPFPVVASGTWKATELISFTPTDPPTYGAHAAGILEMQVSLFPSGGSEIKGATMKVVCNIAPGGLDTRQAEGVTLTVRGGPTFAPDPSVPALTVFSSGREEQEELSLAF